MMDRNQAAELLTMPLEALMELAWETRKQYAGNGFELCGILNGKSGRCTEDCRYCAQSAHYRGNCECYPLLPPEQIAQSAWKDAQSGVRRFSVVTAGRTLNDREVDQLCEAAQKIREKSAVGLCASCGLLKKEQLRRLREAGYTRYHCNIETSRRFFPSICTTHTYDEKIETLQSARECGMSLCSGGILGLGETPLDRVDMALTLQELDVDSVPLNFLNPIPGTPLEHAPRLSEEEFLRTAAIFRMVLPNRQIRLAGGRVLMSDGGRSAIRAGINAMISGDMLTTAGINTQDDLAMVRQMGFEGETV